MSESLVYKDYPTSARHFTSTSPSNESDLGLVIDSDVSSNWKLEWKLAFSYSSESAAPVFSISEPGSGYFWGSEIQLYFDFDYGPGCIQNYDSSTDTLIGTYAAPDYPSGVGTFHFVTITAVIAGYSGFADNDANTVYPTIAVANSGDTCYVLQGFGTATGF